MLNWKYNPENYNTENQLVLPGQYRVRIESAEEQTSKTGKPMIKLTLKVSGTNSRIWYYMVFDDSTPEARQWTDSRLGRIYDSFNITPGNLNLYDWKGKVGAAEIKNEPDNQGTMRAAIKHFIQRNKQDILPAWQEHPTAKVNPEMTDFEDDLPPF